MLRQVLLDQLSEFLMVEQSGLELYRVVGARATDTDLQARYQAFERETAHHREVLIRLIERLGGDPDYVSPTARVAQFKASKLLESSLVTGPLHEKEVELNDLENVLLAETKDQADWNLLARMAEQSEKSGLGAVAQKAGAMTGAARSAMGDGPADLIDTDLLADALQEAVGEVGPQEDEHLSWAREKHAELSLRLGMTGPAPSPERWQSRISNPMVSVDDVHAQPFRGGQLEGAEQAQWQPSPVIRTT